jgi:multisubunit Na+/H+ antiporter MnhC subunit
MELLLWILAVILVVAGIFKLIQRDFLLGVVLIVIGLLVGPGGVSLFI